MTIFKWSTSVCELANVERLGLAPEPVSLGKASKSAIRETLARNGATEAEIRSLLTGDDHTGQRVELNAMTSRQFVEFIEDKLDEHGVAKVLPDAAALADAYRLFVRGTAAAIAVAERTAVDVPADLDARVSAIWTNTRPRRGTRRSPRSSRPVAKNNRAFSNRLGDLLFIGQTLDARDQSIEIIDLYLPCRFALAECPVHRAKIGQGFDVIGFGGNGLLDQPCRRRMVAPLMSDQAQMVEADEMVGLMREDFGIGRLRLRDAPGAEIFERVCQELGVRE